MKKIATERQSTLKAIQELGSQIRSERERRKLSQTDVAELAQVGINFLSQLENGKPTAHIGKVIDVLDVLGLCLRTERKAGKREDRSS